MAGKRVHEIQTYSNCNALVDPTHLSFGAALDRQDVHTAYIGKTDVYAPGKTLGFSEMIHPQDRAWPGDTNHRRNPMTIREGSAARAKGYGPEDNAGAGDVRNVDRAIHWLRTRATQMDTPWILVVNILKPHFPHTAPPGEWELYQDHGDLPTLGLECESAQHPHARELRAHFETEDFAEADQRGLRRGYYACITFVDNQLGRLVDTLGNMGLRETTNVVYTSDHGEMLGKFGMWWKCSLYEDAVRVPMIAAGPDFAQGAWVTTPVDLHDLQASMYAVTGTLQPHGWLGTPLSQIPTEDPGRIVFSEYHGHGARGSAYMIRRGRWKYLHYIGMPAQLFDLESDPEELRNVADTEIDVAATMERELRALCSPEQEHLRAEAFIKRQLKVISDRCTSTGRDNS
jgi:choline-sulfatase